jgi:acetylornithine deacetylase/succinyl-diaminopimelate desuccinylase family protein
LKDAVRAQRESIQADILNLIAMNSENPPGQEEAVAHYVGDRLLALGAEVDYQVVRPGRPNVIGVLDFGPGPSLMLNAHTDTVPVGASGVRLLEPVLRDGKVFGRGACDDKGGLVAMLATCAAAVELKRAGHDIRGTLVLAGVMGEETSGEGTRYLTQHGPLSDYAVVGEPTELLPVLGHKGSWRKRISIHGKAAHSSDPSLGNNAIYGAAVIALEVDAWNSRMKETSVSPFGSPAVSANVISGGDQVIIIADECNLDIDRRMLPGETEEMVDAEFGEVLNTLHGRYPELSVEISDLGLGKSPALLDGESVLAMTILESAREVTGLGEVGPVFVGGTDMTFLMAAGVPTVIFGPGSIKDAHTTGEFVSLADLELAAEVYLNLLCKLATG